MFLTNHSSAFLLHDVRVVKKTSLAYAPYSCDHCSVSQPKQAQTMLFIVVEDAIQHCTVVFEESWTTLLTII